MPIDIVTKSSADVINDVQRAFGDESGFQITTSDIIRWINNAQLEIAMRNPEILPAVAVANSTQGQTDYPLLANVPNVMTLQSVHYRSRPVKNLPFQEAELYLMKGDNVQNPTGQPIFWYERAGIVTFYPGTPDTGTGYVKFFYQKKPDTITGASQTLGLPDLYYNAIVDFCLEQAYLLDENAQLASVAGTKFDQAVMRLQNRTNAQSDYYPFITDVDDWVEDTYTGFSGLTGG